MKRFVASIVVVVACASERDGSTPSDTPGAAQGAVAQPVSASLERFRQLSWIAGRWRGSGGAYPSFYEEYRVVDDSTIQMRALTDSTLSVASDSSLIELRNGTIRKRGDSREYVVVELTPTSVRFAQPGAARGGHTFARTSADEWTATLHPSSAGGAATIYVMRRLQR